MSGKRKCKQCEIHKGTKAGNEETERDVQMKEKKQRRLQQRDKQSIISGVERGHRGVVLSLPIMKGQFVVYEAEKKSKLLTENKI